MKRLPLACATICLLLQVCPAHGQYMFLDSDGDGKGDATGFASPGRSMSVDLWIETDRNADGSSLDYSRLGGTEASINSYEFILRAVGGEVAWEKFTNLQPTMVYKFSQRSNATEYYEGYGGTTYLPPGKYKLGTLSFRIKSGTPNLEFASTTRMWGGARTAFGSRLLGKEFDNTLKFTEDKAKLNSPSEQGDWSDAIGLVASTADKALAPNPMESPRQFLATLSHSASANAFVTVQTKTQGRLVVELFSVTGRRVQVLLDVPNAPPGTYSSARVASGQLPSGLYFYRVLAADGRRQGKVVLLR